MEVGDRFVVRRSYISGEWYVLDWNPGTYSTVEGTRIQFKDTSRMVPRNRHGAVYFRTYDGAANFAARLNSGAVTPKY